MADGSTPLPSTYFPLPPPAVDLQRMATWGKDLTTALRKLQAAGAFAVTSDGDEIKALATTLAEVQAILAGLVKDMDTLTAEGLTAHQKFLLGLVEGVDGVLGTVSRLLKDQWKQAQESARTGGMSLLKGHIDRGIGRTAIINEQLIRQSETEALAQSVVAVNAAIGQTNSNVTAVQQAYAAADQALATQLNTVSTTVAGNSASITQMAQSIDGIKTRWGVSVNAQGQVLGMIRLDGDASGSTFTVVANNFLIALPSVTGGDPKPVFGLGAVNGVATLGMRGDVLLDGTVVARHLSVSSLSAITANMGTVTAGLIKDAANSYEFRVGDGWWGKANGSSYIDMKNNELQFTS